MKALSVKQPWASLIALGIKDIENRTWACPKKYIGTRVLIHASKIGVKDGWRALTEAQIREASNKGLIGYKYGELPSSAIIGSVVIVNCVQNHPSIWAEQGVYNWVLANPVIYDKPISVKGKLSFWEFNLYHDDDDAENNKNLDTNYH